MDDYGDEALERARLESLCSLKNAWEDIIYRYETAAMDDEDGDIIDLETGEVIEDNGHLKGMLKVEFGGAMDQSDEGEDVEYFDDWMTGEEDGYLEHLNPPTKRAFNKTWRQALVDLSSLDDGKSTFSGLLRSETKANAISKSYNFRPESYEKAQCVDEEDQVEYTGTPGLITDTESTVASTCSDAVIPTPSSIISNLRHDTITTHLKSSPFFKSPTSINLLYDPQPCTSDLGSSPTPIIAQQSPPSPHASSIPPYILTDLGSICKCGKQFCLQCV